MRIKLFTIGFTRKPAQKFFETLKSAGVRRVMDVRLHNNSQLAGFAKRDDLRYFLKTISGIDYGLAPELAPTPEIFERFKVKKGDWNTFERQFTRLLAQRKIEKLFQPGELDGVCLLCSEHLPHHCHRRLIAEYLDRHWGAVEIRHLV